MQYNDKLQIGFKDNIFLQYSDCIEIIRSKSGIRFMNFEFFGG